MTSQVTERDRPVRFVDEQVRGPFRSFRHEHRFEAVEDATTMTDQVRFEAPLGPLGRLVERLVLRRHLHALIEGWGQHLKMTAERRS